MIIQRSWKGLRMTPQEQYLGLLKRNLTGLLFEHEYKDLKQNEGFTALELSGLEICLKIKIDKESRQIGKDRPFQAETMIGMDRLNNLEYCIREVLGFKIPGDFLEAGVWRGGASIFMRAMLKVHGDDERTVWVADSFKGFPKRDLKTYPKEMNWDISKLNGALSVSLEEVKANFEKYWVLDDQVKFLEGWFKDTLLAAPIEKLAILRLDGDMYESTIQTLEALYHKVSKGGFVIIDDYLETHLKCCKDAVTDFLTKHDIRVNFQQCGPAVYWRVE